MVQLACPFYLSSTLGVLLKSITTDLGVSRGTFSLMRSLELVAYAAVSPWVGSLLDRYGARGLMVIGAAISVVGFLMLGYARNFWEFTLLRVGPVSIGHALVCYFVINVTISRWFVKKRGRAVAIAHLGQGLSKTTISVVAAYLLTAIGWRRMWMLFGGLVVFLILIPAALFMRRSPEDMGLHPDGAPGPYEADAASNPDASPARTGSGRHHVDTPGSGGHLRLLVHHPYLQHRRSRHRRLQPARVFLHLRHGLLDTPGRDGGDGHGRNPARLGACCWASSANG